MKIGIDIGGSHIASGIVLDNGKLLGKETRDVDFNKQNSIDKEKIKNAREENIANKEEIENKEDRLEEQNKKKIIKIIEEEINILLQKFNYNKEDISKIGIAVPGSPSKTAIKNVVNLHIKEFEIVSILKEKYNCDIIIRNDGKCAGIAEKKYGALKDYQDSVFLCIGTGVGSAVFMNGNLLKPKRAPGFEFGHMVIKKDGRECKCGKNGCFETYASMKRFKEKVVKELGLNNDIASEEVQSYIRKAMKKVENIDAKETISKDNEIKIKEIVDEYIDDLAIGLSNIINIIEPEAICFGGSFVYYEDILLPMLKEKLKKYVFNKDLEYALLPAKLKNDAGIIGAVYE